MSVFEHNHRSRIYNPSQHPYKHSISEFAFTHVALPGVDNLEEALSWIFTVLYPRSQAAVATPAALPAAGNTIGDYRVVTDDGDGNAAGYQWQQREGDAVAKWYKVADMDWGAADILSQFLLKTQDLYVYRYGYDDLDDTGTAITGTLAGQRIFGGATASTNLTLSANSGDGVGADTGYVQVTDHFRPTANNTLDAGTTALKFRTGYFGTSVLAGTLTLAAASITDSSGAISFGDENLTTTGSMTAASFSSGGSGAFGTLTVGSGSITDSSGAISFGNENLTTTGTLASGTHTIGTLVLAATSITDTTGAISFGDENLTTTGSATAGQVNADNLRLDGNTLSVTALDGTLTIAANGTGVVNVTFAMTTIGQTVTGTLAVTGQLNADNLRLDGNTLSSTDTNGNVIVDPNGSGLVELGAAVFPTTHSTWDIGKTGNVWNKLWLDGSIGDGTTEVTSATLQSLRDINSGVSAGMTIFWSGTQWLASVPDSEVDHGNITGIADDDHTQYALLAGRGTGQTLNGGLAASNDLTLHSTAHATKGSVLIAGKLSPVTTATYDFGASGATWNDAYITGQMIGARIENYTTAGRPGAAAGTKGRMYYDTTLDDIYVDRGGTWKKASLEKYVTQDALGWTGSETSAIYTVSSEVSDARECVWVFKNNSDTFKQIGCDITMTQTTVTVTVDIPLAAGTYTLVGVG